MDPNMEDAQATGGHGRKELLKRKKRDGESIEEWYIKVANVYDKNQQQTLN